MHVIDSNNKICYFIELLLCTIGSCFFLMQEHCLHAPTFYEVFGSSPKAASRVLAINFSEVAGERRTKESGCCGEHNLLN